MSIRPSHLALTWAAGLAAPEDTLIIREVLDGPLGWEVDMDVQDVDGDVVHVAFGFWSRDDADRLVHFLDDQIVAVPPPRPLARRVVARQVPRAVARDRRPPSQPE
jgi:hypothetical protein